jgi:hypothetical protein
MSESISIEVDASEWMSFDVEPTRRWSIMLEVQLKLALAVLSTISREIY